MPQNLERLRSIKTFPSLVKYLRDELDWPIESDDVEELSFDYTAEELGLDPKSAVKIKEIKQLRPFVSGQPWGIFFVNFEKAKLPVVAMRLILRALVLKKRASANKSELQAWHPHDLLFISAYGEETDRAITFAHFVENPGNNLGELRVLGWDDDDTPLHMEYVGNVLNQKLKWEDRFESDVDEWRKQWSGAFLLRHRHVVRTSEELARALASLAKRLRSRISTLLRLEGSSGEIRKLQSAFQKALIHDLDDERFADMFAQTVTYGLFSVSVRRTFPGAGTAVTKEDVPNLIVTSPFLKEMLGVFLGLKSRKGDIDFDQLGISDVTDLLTSPNTHMEVVLADFNNKTQSEDPVIHFYEHFLTAYNKKLKIQRGVFYTPQPVVSCIVRSVHELLQTEFSLADGLADTTTWGEMLKQNPGLKLPPLTDDPGETRTISPDEPFVQILDPATGTATFLVEVIDVIYKMLREKWEGAGKSDAEIRALWNDYVPQHLLPRLHAFELMMAPYAIAHMKVGLKLAETGYCFGTQERARIYLTNALEPSVKQLPLIGFDALAHEAAAVNEIKRHKRFTVVIGNPPYSNLSANLTETARGLIEKYKFIGGERVTERNALQLERNLNDDYVKFIAWSEDRLRETGLGILSMISNNVYTWSPSLRGMRSHLLASFSRVRILDLHGASQRGPADSRFADDENVFDIEQPVAIGAFYEPPGRREATTGYTDIAGNRATKYQFLLNKTLPCLDYQSVVPSPPARRFVPSTSDFEEQYSTFVPLSSACPLFAEGIKTGRDWLVIDFDDAPILQRMAEIQNSKERDDALCQRIGLSRKKAWNFNRARAALEGANLTTYVAKLAYRPFDERSVFYHPDWIASASAPVMRNLKLAKSINRQAPNLAILAGRISRDHASRLYWCSRELTDKCILSSLDNVSVFPALVFALRTDDSLNFGETLPEPNLSKDLLAALNQKLGLKKPTADAETLTKWTFDVFHYIYAILWAPSYRTRYGGELNSDFPRLPLTSNLELFRSLARLGGELTALHLLESPELAQPITGFIGGAKKGNGPEVEKISWSNDTVWIDKAQSTGFQGVREDVWNFHIGGYQVCQKWLKDRKGRTLTRDDIAHYHKIVVALSETIRIMAEIDQVIDEHGGWPGAFSQDTDQANASDALPFA